MTSNFVGCRFESDGHYGTILFQGEVVGTEGEWYGVEWDGKTRGKHDGVHKETRYFQTQHPKSGSFLRPHKVKFGVSFMEALGERYGKKEDEGAGVIQEELYLMANGQQKPIEVVGIKELNDYQSQFDKLIDVGLEEKYIKEAGPDLDAIEKEVPNIQQLDLSKNLLATWEEVSKIARQLKKLTILNLSNNRICLPRKRATFSEHFQSVKTLSLNRMNYDWDEILKCAQICRNLEELHVCFNVISEMRDPIPYLQGLTLLTLESNSIGNWEEILKLGVLPKLETLILDSTELTSISFPDTPHTEKTELFPVLKSLSIQRNKLDSWNSVNELNKLQKLQDLKFLHNELPKEKVDDYMLVIAKIAGLQWCNRSTVLPILRKGAEIDYLKYFGKKWKASGGNQIAAKNDPNEEFCEEHPRYQELVDLYGPAEDSEFNIKSSALKNNLRVLTIECDQSKVRKSWVKKLPITMTVQKLKAMIARLFKGHLGSMVLTYISTEMPDKEIEMDSDIKEIAFYSIEDGDTIIARWNHESF